jgi:predicted nucleic acid-binding protein
MTDFIIFIARHWATEYGLIVLGFIVILIIGQRRSVSQVESMADQWVEEIMVEEKKPAEFIHYIDKQLINLNTFAIGFDDTKVPNYKGSFDVT